MIRIVTKLATEVCGRLIAVQVPTLVLVAVTVIATNLIVSGPVSAADQIPGNIEAIIDNNPTALPHGDQVIAIFAVYSDGTMREFYAEDTKVGTQEHTVTVTDNEFAIPDGLKPDQPLWIQVYVANPKICWTTSSGDQVCIVY